MKLFGKLILTFGWLRMKVSGYFEKFINLLFALQWNIHKHFPLNKVKLHKTNAYFTLKNRNH
ncbi:CLUMA_CG010982, isoform A [Clunio marinus]|uniref:CLUMA_CG010982, isoform A n=1 Tax=Clunio marinus TaxID=568069 RepID=A0A1J1IBK6_9DIPT|nr:CLUMA_CG010982, isoform A [Clunio marinus]